MSYHIYRKVLRLVSKLHLHGYQCLRIAPGMSSSGMHWRCSITPVVNILACHGAQLQDWEKAVTYSSSMQRNYFNWNGAAHCTPNQLAEIFIIRFPEMVAAEYGPDWSYAGWYVDMLHKTYPNALPVAYSDYEEYDDYLGTVGGGNVSRFLLPPPGRATV